MTDRTGVPAVRTTRRALLAAGLLGAWLPCAAHQLRPWPPSRRAPALRLPLLAPWAAADAIIDNGQRPNYASRMGLSDTLAIDALLGPRT